jgi:hypothetical protein
MRVLVVFDKSFGVDPPVAIPATFWLIDSVANRALAERLSQNEGHDPNSAVFNGDLFTSVAEAAVSTYLSVAEHHPAWTEMEFVGLALSKDLERVLEGEKVSLTKATHGFVISRRSLAP